eukprot:scaffold12561_cov47-Phaeocystis_antarctica.AAC.1
MMHFICGEIIPRRVPRAAARAGWAKSIDSLLRHEVEDVHRLGSLGYQTGPSEPQLTTSGRATCTKWLMSKRTPVAEPRCERRYAPIFAAWMFATFKLVF